jgi:hypothetical protein|tara:strand:- start:340 stop:540 length:201 start_codon:yes stop_codon:yes gene_type:complete
VKLASLERVIALLGWLATASAGVLLLTQAVGWNGSTGNGLVSTSVQDFTVPGSDHRGFVVSVVPAR